MEEALEEQRGIEAIVFLQSIAGVEETTDMARAGWRKMTAYERAFTLELHEALKKNAH